MSKNLLLSSSISPVARANRPSGFELSKVRCRIHPSVILTILDAHGRLQEPNTLAIGTLLGTIHTSESGLKGGSAGMVVVEIVDCFANPYIWDTKSSSLTIQNEWMLKLREKINPKLTVVGWCYTTPEIVYTTALSDWAKAEPKASRFVPTKALLDPIHVLVDPRFTNSLSVLDEIKAYVRGPLRQLFHEIPVEITINPADTLGIASIIKSSSTVLRSPAQEQSSTVTSLQDSSEDLISSLKSLQSLVAPCLQYIKQVLRGEREGDATIGRALSQGICSDTLLQQEEVEAICETTMQDNLMIAYLATLARLQFTVAEKLNTSFN